APAKRPSWRKEAAMSSGDGVTESKPGLTRGKLVLIGTLGSTLISVLWVQFSGEDTETKPARKGGKAAAHAPAIPAGTAVASANTAAGQAVLPQKDARPFPEISQEEILQHDPFA